MSEESEVKMRLSWEDYVRLVKGTCAPKRRTFREWWEENRAMVEMGLCLLGVAVFICGLAVCSSLYRRGGV